MEKDIETYRGIEIKYHEDNEYSSKISCEISIRSIHYKLLEKIIDFQPIKDYSISRNLFQLHNNRLSIVSLLDIPTIGIKTFIKNLTITQRWTPIDFTIKTNGQDLCRPTFTLKYLLPVFCIFNQVEIDFHDKNISIDELVCSFDLGCSTSEMFHFIIDSKITCKTDSETYSRMFGTKDGILGFPYIGNDMSKNSDFWVELFKNHGEFGLAEYKRKRLDMYSGKYIKNFDISKPVEIVEGVKSIKVIGNSVDNLYKDFPHHYPIDMPYSSFTMLTNPPMRYFYIDEKDTEIAVKYITKYGCRVLEIKNVYKNVYSVESKNRLFNKVKDYIDKYRILVDE